MANITAADIKRLRDHTGSGMMAAKQALTDADGDFDKAVELLRLKGAKDVGKRAERTADNGLVTVKHTGTTEAVLVQLNCETDFVAKNERFQELAATITGFAATSKPEDVTALLGAEIEPGKTVQALIDEASALIGEKLELPRYAHVEGAYVASYLHKSDPDLPPTLGVLIELDGENEQVARDVAQQIAAMAPKYLSRDEVPEDVVANERRLAEQMARDEGKPEQAISKIVDGRVNSFFKDFALLEQPFVKENKKTVGKVLSEAGVTAKRFARFKVGQA